VGFLFLSASMTYRDGGSVFFSSTSVRVGLVYVFAASFINLI